MAVVTISKANVHLWQNQIDKARSVKPRMAVTGYGHFKVVGSKGNKYTVILGVRPSGVVEATCECEASGRCYHIAAVAPVFKSQVAERTEARRQYLRLVEKEQSAELALAS